MPDPYGSVNGRPPPDGAGIICWDPNKCESFLVTTSLGYLTSPHSRHMTHAMRMAHAVDTCKPEAK